VLAETTIAAVLGAVIVVAICIGFFIYNKWRRRRTI
jgi:UDP-N-acetylmuramyl pentapeptide phosphotransferase/UDP-N-acetylglucosamine-1-phosphate transferase